mgnify:CR=1 FL=1
MLASALEQVHRHVLVGEALEAPVLGLGGRAAEFFDGLGDVLDEGVDLLRRDFRPRNQHVFVISHNVLFQRPAAS